MSLAFLPTCFPARELGSKWQSAPELGGWQIRRFSGEADWRDWARENSDPSCWMSADFLECIQTNSQGLHSEAIALRHPDFAAPVFLTVQSFRLQLDRRSEKTASLRVRMGQLLRSVISSLAPRTLVIGQMLISGPYGSSGLENLPAREAAELLQRIGSFLLPSSCTLLLLKDTAPSRGGTAERLRKEGFVDLPVDPVMEMDLRDLGGWEDYLASLTSKYRVRYRRARKQLQGIRRKMLSRQEVILHLDTIYDLHRETRAGAEFKFVQLSKDYFAWLADRAVFHAYFHDHEMIGFTTGLVNGRIYHAHYLGLREAYKGSHHLYHNMLYDLLEDALAEPVDTLDYGRTALEIKSSVGALPVDSPVLAKAGSAWLNRLLKPVTNWVRRPPEWTERNPFK